MYQHHIDGMTDLIVKRFYSQFERNTEIGKVVQDALKDYWTDRVAVVWQSDDILEKAEELGIQLTKQQVRDILQVLIDKHDCEHGITWDTIEYAVEEYRKEE